MNPTESGSLPKGYRTVAAMDLGFYSRAVAIDGLDACLVALCDDIHHNLFTGLQQGLVRLSQSFADHEARSLAFTPTYPDQKFPEWGPSILDSVALVRLADNALKPNSALQGWYHLGVILGEWENRKADGEIDADRLERLVNHVQSLPSMYIDSVRVLKQLRDFDGEKLLPRDHLRRVIELAEIPDLWPFEFPPRSILYLVKHAIEEDLGNFKVFEIGSMEERNAWIHWADCAGVIYETIKVDLKLQTQWKSIESIQGIIAASDRHADDNQIARAPGRKSGRLPSK